MLKPELLSPAGTYKNLQYALSYGADAVYAGQPRYSLRVRQNDFDKLTRLAQGIRETQAQGKRFYLASNLIAHNAKLHTFLADLEPIVEMGPDALIMADPGLIMLVRDRWPDLAIHLSVQANTMNFATVQFWQKQGISRIILSRELSLEEIAEIRQRCPDMELEVFIHGALCIAHSGRCLLSGYFNHREANQGTCTNSCRWEYQLKLANQEASGDIFVLEERERLGNYLPIWEDEHGSYILNSKDLCAVRQVADLMKIGVNALKIEGRTKSHYYVARTAQVYRQVIDQIAAGQSFDEKWVWELEKLAHRGYTEGFYVRHAPQNYQNYEEGSSNHGHQQFVGEVVGKTGAWLAVQVKNHFEIGDRLELLLPQGNVSFTLEQMQDEQGEFVHLAPGSGHQRWILAPQVGEIEQGLLLKNL